MLTANDWPRIPLYAEVKAWEDMRTDTGLSWLQAERLDDLSKARLLTRLLVLVDNRYWLVSDGPFLSGLGYVKTSVELQWRETRELHPHFFMWSEFLEGYLPATATG
jgi:hypothetical protein